MWSSSLPGSAIIVVSVLITLFSTDWSPMFRWLTKKDMSFAPSLMCLLNSSALEEITTLWPCFLFPTVELRRLSYIICDWLFLVTVSYSAMKSEFVRWAGYVWYVKILLFQMNLYVWFTNMFLKSFINSTKKFFICLEKYFLRNGGRSRFIWSPFPFFVVCIYRETLQSTYSFVFISLYVLIYDT